MRPWCHVQIPGAIEQVVLFGSSTACPLLRLQFTHDTRPAIDQDGTYLTDQPPRVLTLDFAAETETRETWPVISADRVARA